MTNAQKYEEVFGMPVDKEMCPTAECELCPIKINSRYGCEGTGNWWNNEYKEPETKCATCAHDGEKSVTGNCIKCRNFDRYEKREEDQNNGN